MIDRMPLALAVAEVVQEASKARPDRKAVIQRLQRLQPTRPHRSHPIRRQAVATTIHRKLRMTSQPELPAPLVTLRSDHQPDPDSADLSQEPALVNLIQALKLRRAAHHTQELRDLRAVHLTPPQVNDRQAQLLVAKDHRPSVADHQEVSFHRNKRQRAEPDSDQAFRAAEAEAADHRRRASKMKVKKATTQPFPANRKSIIQSSLKFLKRRSIAISKSFQATMLTSKLAVKCSTFVR